MLTLRRLSVRKLKTAVTRELEARRKENRVLLGGSGLSDALAFQAGEIAALEKSAVAVCVGAGGNGRHGRAPVMAPGSPRERRIDPKTGIWPISEWGSECERGFVSDARFGPGTKVIKRTNRNTTRKWRRSEGQR